MKKRNFIIVVVLVLALVTSVKTMAKETESKEKQQVIGQICTIEKEELKVNDEVYILPEKARGNSYGKASRAEIESIRDDRILIDSGALLFVFDIEKEEFEIISEEVLDMKPLSDNEEEVTYTTWGHQEYKCQWVETVESVPTGKQDIYSYEKVLKQYVINFSESCVIEENKKIAIYENNKRIRENFLPEQEGEWGILYTNKESILLYNHTEKELYLYDHSSFEKIAQDVQDAFVSESGLLFWVDKDGNGWNTHKSKNFQDAYIEIEHVFGINRSQLDPYFYMEPTHENANNYEIARLYSHQ